MRFSLLQPLCDIPFAVIDTETTGASASLGHKVIEVGIVRLEAGREVARYEQLIDPNRPISAGVTALTGISQDMVAGQPRFPDQLPAMMRVLEGAAILGHNIRFDLSFLAAEFRRAGHDITQSLGDVPVFDTVRIARRRFGRGGNSLPILSRRLGIDPVTSHRALADAITTAALFNTLLQPVGGYNLGLCDALAHQGGPIPLISPRAAESLLPLELEEALDARKPVLMEYVDASGLRTQRVVEPLTVRRRSGELMLVAHCQLRSSRRTFKLDRIVRLSRYDPDAQTFPACDDIAEPGERGPDQPHPYETPSRSPSSYTFVAAAVPGGSSPSVAAPASAAPSSPSPGTPGEGRGEGSVQFAPAHNHDAPADPVTPHPDANHL